jgi:hypothetical protein
MPDSDPAIRAHYAKLALKRLRAYPEGKWAEIRERIPADSLTQIREAASPDWLGVEMFLAICESILGVLGDEAARGFWTDLMRDSYDHGLLKPLTAAAQFSSGPSGASKLLKTAPHAWTLSTRACGDIEFVDDGAGAMRLRGVDLIPEILHSKGFACVFYGACRAMLELFKSRGEVRIYEHVPPGAERPQIAFEILFERTGPA